MSSLRRAQPAPEDLDWSTGSLTGLIPPKHPPADRAATPPVPLAPIHPATAAPALAVSAATRGPAPVAPPQPLASVTLPHMTPPPPSATPPSSPPPPTTGSVRWAIYGLLAVIGLGACWVLAGSARTTRSSSGRALSVASAAAASGAVAPPAKPRASVSARDVKSPTPKAAAAAFARGDYGEALGQYRALARLYPEESAYPALVRVLERRLAPKLVSD